MLSDNGKIPFTKVSKRLEKNQSTSKNHTKVSKRLEKNQSASKNHTKVSKRLETFRNIH